MGKLLEQPRNRSVEEGSSVTSSESAGPARWHVHPTASLGRCCPTAELLAGEGQQEPSPGLWQRHPERLHGAHPAPSHLDPTLLPQMLPIWEVTDQFSAKRGKRQPGSGKRGQEERCCVCCVLRNLCLTPRRGSLPCPEAPGSDIPGAHGNPQGEINPCLSKERRQMQPGHCSRHLQRSGISPSLWCLLVASLTSCRGCAEASDHSSPTHLEHETLPGTKGEMAKVQHGPGRETGPEVLEISH